MLGLPKFGDGIAIPRMLRFYAERGIDRERLARRSIVVVGSNGKGSTARFLSAALGVGGKRVGCFTSPHLFNMRERFLIGDDPIPADMFDALCREAQAFNDRLPEGDRMGAFEILFLVAILWFEREAPDAIVWEAGIGGRYDPIRTLKAPMGVLTGLELEHTQLLGATEELIAYDKIDALAPGGTLVVSRSVSPHHYPRIAAYCDLAGKIPVFAAESLCVADAVNLPSGTRFTLSSRGAPDRRRDMQLNLVGPHQIDNALAAYVAACTRAGRKTDPLADGPVLDALATVRWPGRLERVARGTDLWPELWIDVGHTPHAADLVTSAFLDFTPRERTLVVFGVSASKEVDGIAEIVASRFDRFILTQAHKAGADPAAFAHVFAGKDVRIAPDTASAAALAKSIARSEHLTVLAIGGLFLAVEIAHAWTGGDPLQLEFF